MQVASARIDALFSDEATADTFAAAFGARIAALGVLGAVQKIAAFAPSVGWRVVATLMTRAALREQAVSWARGELYAPAYAGRVLGAGAHEWECCGSDRFVTEREAWSR